MTDRYLHEGQQRLMDLMLALAGREFTGLLPGEIAKGLGITPSCVTRDLANLKAKGFAEQIQDTGRWRLGPKVVQIGLAFAEAAEHERARLAQITQRYTRSY